MPRPSQDAPVTLSILDRLTDLEPKNRTTEAPLSRAESVRRLKAGLRRDLEWLLNTRRISGESNGNSSELAQSVYHFGVPDFSTFNIGSPKDQAKLMRTIKNTVDLFEPRLAGVRLSVLESNAQGTRSVRFRLEGLLRMDPAPEHVSFDTVLQLTTGDFQVRGSGDA